MMSQSINYDKLSVRLAQILMRLNDRERLSAQELADEFGVDVRTIRRDLHERLAFMPIKKEDDQYFLESFALGKLSFKDVKNFASLSGIAELYPRLDASFIVDLLSEKVNHALMVHTAGFEAVDYEEFEKVSSAILKHACLRFGYKGKERLLNPYKLANHKGVWYIVGDEAGKLKHFTLSKACNIRVNFEEVFTPRQEFLERIAKNETEWLGSVKKAILWVRQDAREYFFRKPVWRHYEMIEEGLDGFSVRVSFSYDDEVLHFVKQWIPYIRIIEPVELKEKLCGVLEDYLKEC